MASSIASYNYIPGTNKLKNVIDAVNEPATTMGDFRSSQAYTAALGTKTPGAADYSYDDNGNLLKEQGYRHRQYFRHYLQSPQPAL